MVSKTTVGIVAGAATLFVLYCFYFDRKRTSHPDYKKRIRERRKAEKEARKLGSKIPNFKDHDLVQKFFMSEIEMGEELLAQGDIDGGTEHLANAIAVCGQPHHLLEVLQKSLPPQVFHMLLQRLPTTGQKLNMQAATMAEEDVE